MSDTFSFHPTEWLWRNSSLWGEGGKVCTPSPSHWHGFLWRELGEGSWAESSGPLPLNGAGSGEGSGGGRGGTGSSGPAPLFPRRPQHQLGSVRCPGRVSLRLPWTFHYAPDLKFHSTLPALTYDSFQVFNRLNIILVHGQHRNGIQHAGCGLLHQAPGF